MQRLLAGERQNCLSSKTGWRAGQCQPEAGGAVAASIAGPGRMQDATAGGSFLFLGPTGVGQTELARPWRAGAVRFEEGPGAPRYERIHGAQRVGLLLGAPPGYVGYEEGRPAHRGDRGAPLCRVAAR